MGLLTRDGDRPSPDEEHALETMRLREIAILDDIDGRLERSARRTVIYETHFAGDNPYAANKAFDGLRSERRAQDRILDERLRATGIETPLA